MKRYLIFLSIFAVLGAGFGYLLNNKSTYVLLTYETYAFESSLWFLMIVLVITFFVFNFILNTLLKFYRPGRRFSAWSFNRKVEASKRDFYQAILDFETGDWDKAFKKFQTVAHYLDRPIVAHLYAARSAQKLGRKAIKDEMLHAAAQAEPKSSLAVGIVRAELLIEENNTQEALNILTELKQAAPNNQQIQFLLAHLSASN